MRRLYIALLLMVIPWAGPACAQAAEIWNAQDDDDHDLVADGRSDGASFKNWWFSADMLMWWTKSTPVPVPLATTAPASALTNPADKYPPGNLANRDTTVVLGGNNVAIPMQFGGRFTMGTGLDDNGRFGVETGFLFLPTRMSSTSVASNGHLNQFLTNPYTALDSVAFPPPGTPYANFLSGPNSFNGPLGHFGAAKLVNKLQIYGAELNGVWNAWDGNGQSWQLLGGYRFFNVGEQLSLATTQVDNNNFTGQFIDTLDQFKTQNFFNGGQLGVRWDRRWGNWYLGSIIKVAAGSTHEEVTINGSTTTNTGAAFTHIPVTTVPYGTYAQPTNIGHYTRDQFAWLPDVSLKLGFQPAPAVRYYVGYNFLYLSNLARPGSQIDGTINPLQTVGFNGGLPTSPNGGGRPAPRIESTDFWAQGVTIGAEFGW
jgi:hypothetical protein